MATNRRFMPVPPDAVWDVLADAGSYEYWVVGSKAVRDADPAFPAPGTRFHHTQGFGPLTVRDHTEVLDADPPRRLRLRAKARPVGMATVTLSLEPRDGGTVVEIEEHPAGPFALLELNPAFSALTRVRNARALMRLEDLALRRSGA